MFVLENYLKESPANDIHKIRIHDEEYKIRRLDGIELLQLQDITETDKKFVLILSRCLLDGKTEKPVGEAGALILLRNHLVDAIEIIHAIIDLSEEIRDLEEKTMVELKKNS